VRTVRICKVSVSPAAHIARAPVEEQREIVARGEKEIIAAANKREKDAAGEAKELPLRPTFDRRIKLDFHGARITSDGGLLAYRELDAALGLTEIAISVGAKVKTSCA
jgi:hypothetical protein